MPSLYMKTNADILLNVLRTEASLKRSRVQGKNTGLGIRKPTLNQLLVLTVA